MTAVTVIANGPTSGITSRPSTRQREYKCYCTTSLHKILSDSVDTIKVGKSSTVLNFES